MEKTGLEGSQITSPQEELTRLRESTILRTEQAKESGIEMTPRQATQETVKQYVTTKPQEVLHPEYLVKDKEVEAIVLELSPETHDRDLEPFIDILQKKGIRNAMTVIERLNNPHLLDDFHRFLVQFIASGYSISDLKEKSELWKPLHMTLFEVSLPEVSESDKEKQLKDLISGMEQFYSGMLSISADKKDPRWFSIEIANSNGSDEFVFYVAVPTTRKDLFLKQILAIFPNARAEEHKNDYNIFNSEGSAAASFLSLSKHFLYPLKAYSDFNVDPLNSILSAFSKTDCVGEGAAIQLIVGERQDLLMKESAKAVEEIRKGEKISDALDQVGRSASTAVAKEIFGIFQNSKDSEKEKESKTKRAGSLDQTTVEQFTRKLKSPFVAVNLRVIASAGNESEAQGILRDIESSFNQF